MGRGLVTMTFALGMALGVLGCGGAQGGGTPRVDELRGGAADLWVVAEGRRALPMYMIEGEHHLLGAEGERYEICLGNRLEGRLEAVVSVDGRDVISGRDADYRADRGYVLDPGEELCIEGFRRSLSEVAAFEFSSIEESYAARMGDASNVGVIGVALFEEEPVEAPPPPMPIAAGEDAADEKRSAMPAAPGAGAAVEAEQQAPGIGTRYGDDVGSAAEIVPFKRLDTDRPSEVLVLYYDDRAGLEARGVVFDETAPEPRREGPDPFPGVQGDGFAPPPPGR